MNSFSKEKILVLGASSWLGYLLVYQLLAKNVKVGGTIFHSNIAFPNNIKIFRVKGGVCTIEEIIQTFKPTVIINFLRGEDDAGFKLHQSIIQFSKVNNIHYVYASSILALDGYKNQALVEELKAKSVSPYGIFKAKCEKELYNSSISWCILRFASVQGWVPHKLVRNQQLLEKLANNEEIMVDRGVMQNRMLASLLIEGVIDLIEDRITGIIHFGTYDSSEEYQFLKKQAIYFDFPSELIQIGNQRNVNLVAVPNRIYELYGDKYKVSEEETLQGLLKIKELKQINIS